MYERRWMRLGTFCLLLKIVRISKFSIFLYIRAYMHPYYVCYNIDGVFLHFQIYTYSKWTVCNTWLSVLFDDVNVHSIIESGLTECFFLISHGNHPSIKGTERVLNCDAVFLQLIACQLICPVNFITFIIFMDYDASKFGFCFEG